MPKSIFPKDTLDFIPFQSYVGPNTQEGKGLDAVAWVKFFTPDSGWTWWASEFDGEDLFFGVAHGAEQELGYFRLSELKEIRGVLGLPVERDRFYRPKTLRELME